MISYESMGFVKEIVDYSFQLVEVICNVEEKRNTQNLARMDATSELMPCELVKMRTGEFITKVLDPYRDGMKHF